jgi:threonine dehydrogenase-like Zn-dependent dehydrogenase
MKALVIENNLPRFGASLIASTLRPSAATRLAPLKLKELSPADLPSPDWVRIAPRLAGICGSDLATVHGKSSRWFEPIVSFPFTPGHEVVANDPDGRRVVVEPVLGCVARGLSPVCTACAQGRLGNCERLTQGCVDAGLQSGFCCDTGGGWSTEMLAHPSQLHEVPDELSDAAAVMIEPTACGLHAALSADVQSDETVVIIGAGTLGLVTIAALNRWSPPQQLIVAAKYSQQQSFTREFSADSAKTTVVCEPANLIRTVRSNMGTYLVSSNSSLHPEDDPHSRLSGGADVTIDCVGNAESLRTALAVTRPGGRVVLVGMPGVQTVDLTPLWQREISLSGAYTYGTEILQGTPIRSFDLAAELVAAADLGRLVSATYPLTRFPEALAHASSSGSRGGVKIAFDLHSPDYPAAPMLSTRKAARR